MKSRIFYVIHLDRNRIFFLTLLFIGFTLCSFALGNYMGEAQSVTNKTNLMDSFFRDTSNRDVEEDLGKAQKEEEKKPIESDIIESDILEYKSNEVVTGAVKFPPIQPIRKVNSFPKKGKKLVQLKKANPKKIATSQKKSKKLSQFQGAVSPKDKLIEKQVPQRIPLKRNKTNSLRLSNTGKKNPVRQKPFHSRSQSSSYYLQLGAFRSQNSANSMLRGLKKLGFSPEIHKKGELNIIKIGDRAPVKKIEKLEKLLRENKYFPIRNSYAK